MVKTISDCRVARLGVDDHAVATAFRRRVAIALYDSLGKREAVLHFDIEVPRTPATPAGPGRP